ncbi:hypothetical protein ACWD0J_33690 [Streptomyces sp. NPDC003011]
MPKAYAFTRYDGPETEARAEADRLVPGSGRILVAAGAEVAPVTWVITPVAR